MEFLGAHCNASWGAGAGTSVEEYTKLRKLEAQKKILVVGARSHRRRGVTMLEYFFPQMKLTIIDFLPRCLGPLPDSAADLCSEYMHASSIKDFYECKYDPKSEEFWKRIELPGGADDSYVCIGVKTSNYFMQKKTFSEKSSNGGGWIIRTYIFGQSASSSALRRF